jgi:hypothetical protein
MSAVGFPVVGGNFLKVLNEHKVVDNNHDKYLISICKPGWSSVRERDNTLCIGDFFLIADTRMDYGKNLS